MAKRGTSISKAAAAEVLRHAGFSSARIEEMLAPLPDPFDLDRHGDVLVRYGVTRGQLIERMGGSP